MRQVDVQRSFRLTLADLCRLLLWLGFLSVLVLSLPNNLYSPQNRRIIIVLGLLGLWRYSWWAVHFVRSQVYARFVFPPIRRRAEELWQSGWRPKRILYMITTFREVKDTTERLMNSLITEVRDTLMKGLFVLTSAGMPRGWTLSWCLSGKTCPANASRLG